MSDDLIAHYGGYGIKLTLTQLQSGEWTGNFTLIRDGADEINYAPYHGSPAFPTREEAKQAALDAARSEINKISATQL